MKHKLKKLVIPLVVVILIAILAACAMSDRFDTASSDTAADNATFSTGDRANQLRIVAGSENKEIEPILTAFSQQEKIDLNIDYKGSVEIMQILENGGGDYDAVWPANSMWITMGDTQHKVKHAESTSTTPVVFGIKKSLAEELGFVGRDVSVSDILSAIQSGKLRFCMTSATQSNSGANAYIGFLYALLGHPDMITSDDLDNPQLQTQIRTLLSGIDRSSGSSEWLKDLYVSGDYDAMVNYESLIISANEALTAEGREPLYVIYPYDGLTIADSPLGYIDNGNAEKESAFMALQEYLLSDDVQEQIEATGRRTGYDGVSDANKAVFSADWGIDTERILSPIKMPAADVIKKALNLYQTAFRKPSLTIYCLDFSGSMYGEGQSQLINAMQQLLDQNIAAENFLQATPEEVNIILPFSDNVMNDFEATGNNPDDLNALYKDIQNQSLCGGTNLYGAAIAAVDKLNGYDLNNYSPAIVLMTDGQANGTVNFEDFKSYYTSSGVDVPVFSILFGDADEEELKPIAELTGGRVFDGREDLTGSFRAVKGYN